MGIEKDKGWKQYAAAIDAKGFDKSMMRHLRVASQKNGLLFVKAIRQSIKGGEFEPNKALTVAIKGSSKPLVDHGDLFQAITYKLYGDTKVFIGVLKTAAGYNIAAMLHEGAAIKVTKAMRALFFVLWQASEGKIDPAKLTGRAAELFERMSSGWYPLKDSTRVIVIPARPFIKVSFWNPELIAKAEANWHQACAAAIAERAKAGG